VTETIPIHSLDETMPDLAARLGMSDAEFRAFVAQRFPAVAAFTERGPEVFTYLEPAAAQVAAQADDVEEADDFPAPGVPLTAGPWALLAAGLVVIVLGVAAHRSTGRRGSVTLAAAVAVAGLGIGLVAAPLLLTWPSKVDAAEEVAEAARVAFTPEVARAATADIYAVDAALLELGEAVVPAVAEATGQTRAEVEASLADDYPAVARLAREWESGLSASAHDLSQSQIQFMDEFHLADATPYRALPWLFLVPGLVVSAVGLGAFVLARRR
jgi:hypothetical protein